MSSIHDAENEDAQHDDCVKDEIRSDVKALMATMISMSTFAPRRELRRMQSRIDSMTLLLATPH